MNAKNSKITTIEQARDYIRTNNRRALCEDIAGVRNVDQVEIDLDCDVWVGNPQPHWLSEAELIETIAMLAGRNQ